MSARVLVVDDVEINVKLLEAKLSSEYFNVLPAFNGATALRLAADELPDVILLDVMMPQMDGFEVCRRLKADPATADIPVVMVTALSDVADRLRGLEAGADDFLTKPVNDIALFARVRSLVRLKRMMDEWKLREEVCGRFAAVPDDAANQREAERASRILVVEDNRLAAAKITETLKPLCQEIEVVTRCSEAMDAIGPDTELVIIGMSVADEDPLRLLSQFRAVEGTRQLPVLLVADEGEMPRLAKGLDLGANDYVVRPLDRNELTARVRTQIRRKRLSDRLLQNYQRSLSLALTDPLTGLYNRRYVSAHLDSLMTRAEDANRAPAAALLFDIDHFKRVNDTWGHQAGDEVLCEVAARATRDVRSFDLVARFGGEEFVVIMPEATLALAMVVAERLRTSIAERGFAISGKDERLSITISVGVALALDVGDTPQALLRRADEALYAAKHAGRNRVVAATNETLVETPVRLLEVAAR